jgi:transcription antitermination factor NusG
VLVCPGVVNIVSFAGVPAPVDENEIEAIRRIANSGIKTFPWPFLSVGHRVSIERGPLKGLNGIVVEVKNRFRMVASVTLLQRSVSVELEREWVRPLQNFKLACA